MALIEDVERPGLSLALGRKYRSALVEVRPLDYVSKNGEVIGGHYRTVAVTGLITILNAADAILSMRWTNPNKLLVLHRLRLWAVITTAFGAAQEVSFDLVKVNGWVVSDSAGTAAAAALNAGAGRKRSDMAPSVITDFRVSGAVALTKGTSVEETAAAGFAALQIGNVAGSTAAETLYDIAEQSGEHPLICGVNEGFRTRIGFTQGAAGVMRVSSMMDWAEVPAY